METLFLLAWLSASYAEDLPEQPLAPIACDRVLQRLPDPGKSDASVRAAWAAAGEHLGDWRIDLAGVAIDGPRLAQIAADRVDEPFTRVAREALGRAIDPIDAIYFFDDVLVAGAAGRRGEPFSVNSGRGRNAGILLHPDDVWVKAKPRVYGARSTLSVDTPQPQRDLPQAVDGDPPHPGWAMRFQNPAGWEESLEALDRAALGADFGSRVHDLLTQLERQGAEVYVASTLRDRTRGYLMWGAFELARQRSEADVDKWLAKLDDRRKRWQLHAPITWKHPDGWLATIEGARQLRDTYDVVYATEGGARNSNHYAGFAADFIALALPATLVLVAPDGVEGRFDLSDANASRDLSLEPELVRWIEAHYGMRKLLDDYPHWDDRSVVK